MVGGGGVEGSPQSGLGAAVVADGDLAGAGEFFAQPFDAVVERVWSGAPTAIGRRIEGGVRRCWLRVGGCIRRVGARWRSVRRRRCDVAALGELVVDVAFGAVVAHEFHFAAQRYQVDGEVEGGAGVEVVEGLQEF